MRSFVSISVCRSKWSFENTMQMFEICYQNVLLFVFRRSFIIWERQYFFILLFSLLIEITLISFVKYWQETAAIFTKLIYFRLISQAIINQRVCFCHVCCNWYGSHYNVVNMCWRNGSPAEPRPSIKRERLLSVLINIKMYVFYIVASIIYWEF